MTMTRKDAAKQQMLFTKKSFKMYNLAIFCYEFQNIFSSNV